MHIEQHAVTVTTNGDGDGTSYTPVVTGRILSIRYVKDDFTNGVDFDITAETSGQTIWDQDNVDASATVLPRQATHSVLGVAASYAENYPVLEPVYVANERIKIVVANGGDSHSGTFYVMVG